MQLQIIILYQNANQIYKFCSNKLNILNMHFKSNLNSLDLKRFDSQLLTMEPNSDQLDEAMSTHQILTVRKTVKIILTIDQKNCLNYFCSDFQSAGLNENESNFENKSFELFTQKC